MRRKLTAVDLSPGPASPIRLSGADQAELAPPPINGRPLSDADLKVWLNHLRAASHRHERELQALTWTVDQEAGKLSATIDHQSDKIGDLVRALEGVERKLDRMIWALIIASGSALAMAVSAIGALALTLLTR